MKVTELRTTTESRTIIVPIEGRNSVQVGASRHDGGPWTEPMFYYAEHISRADWPAFRSAVDRAFAEYQGRFGAEVQP